MNTSILLLNSDENTRAIEDEEKSRFIYSILEVMGVPVSDIWDPDSELTIENKIKLKSLLSAYNIKIIDFSDGELQVYVDNELIAEWKKCEYKLKRDLSEIDPKKKLYLEMKTNYWSIFDEEK